MRSLLQIELNPRRLVALLLGFRRSLDECLALDKTLQELDYALNSNVILVRWCAYLAFMKEVEEMLKNAHSVSPR